MDKRLKKETLLYAAGRYSSVLITLLTTCILSRLLTPQEYGIVAVTAVFTALFSVISEFGFGAAVIQDKTLTEDQINDIFSFSLYLAVALACAFALLGIPVSAFYQNEVYRPICALLSISVFFTAANIVPHGVLMRHKRFKLMGMRLIGTVIFSGVISIALAYAGFGYYTLVIQSILNALFCFVWNMWNAPLRFKWHIHLDSVHRIYRYSVNLFGFNLVNYCENNLDSFLIGKILGSESLAYYDKGYRLMTYPVSNLTHVINPVIHPILSEYQNDKPYIYQAYMKLVRVLSMLGVFFSVACFWAGEEIILFFFGGQWNNAIPLFKVLALSVWPQMLTASTPGIYRSTGDTTLMFRSSLLHAVLMAALIGFGVATHDLEKTALMVTISLYARFAMDYYFLVVKNFGYSYVAFLKSFAGELLIAAIMIAAMLLLGPVMKLSGFVALAAKMMVMGCAFMIGLAVTGEYRLITSFFRRK